MSLEVVGSFLALRSTGHLVESTVATTRGRTPESKPDDRVPRTGLKVYAWSVCALGVVPVAHSLSVMAQGRAPIEWLLFTALTLFTGFFAIRVPSLYATVSATESFVFAAALLFGPAAATVTVMLDGLIVVIRSDDRRLYRSIFSITEPAISVWVSAQLFFFVSGAEPRLGHTPSIWAIALPILLLTTSYFALNTVLTGTAIKLDGGLAFRAFLRANAGHVSVNFAASIFLLVLVALNAEHVVFAAVGIMLPMLGLSYYMSRTTMESVEESNRYLSNLNSLYLSSVEALEMAIDFKDQVTRGHIGRVQEAVVVMGKRLGIHGSDELMTLRAGALLHDLGKIGVPEHILNKPGPLSACEFEVMKTHATIWADIVAQMKFPYPVEPIVRHHHENWDGAGYPVGLSGTDIPLACRILAVVDCYDALRSDRPYRRGMDDREAMQIIQERRGTTYDPTIVDEFTRIRAQLGLGDVGEESTPLRSSITPTASPRPERPRVVSGEHAAAESLPEWIRAVAPDALAILYVHDEQRSVLTPIRISRAGFDSLFGLEILLGKRISGWVAVNRRAVLNADPNLDFESQTAEALSFKSCLSVAVEDGEELRGVLSLYATVPTAFSQEQLKVIESMKDLIPLSLLSGGPDDSALLTHQRPEVERRPALLERMTQA